MARRPGLGRGLNALIPGNEDQEQSFHPASPDRILNIPIEAIDPNPQQPREEMATEALAELAASIREHGIIQPLIVSRNQENERYVLIAGERRLRAAKIAGLSMVPAIERSVTEQGQLELALIENLQREDLNPLEMAEAYRQLVENFSFTHEEIAQSGFEFLNFRGRTLPRETRWAFAAHLFDQGSV